MGIIGPGPGIVYGNDCDVCEPALWADGETPLFVIATFENIFHKPGHPCHHCSDIPSPFVLSLKQTLPCIWNYNVGDFMCEWAPVVSLKLRVTCWLDPTHAFNAWAFQGWSAPICDTDFVGGDETCYSGGTGKITW